MDWQLNCLDRRGQGLDGMYLTLTGTSAEDADSGQVGRGNRADGLIAFSRPTAAKPPLARTPRRTPGRCTAS
jgi:S-adenosylmethionine synthetase